MIIGEEYRITVRPGTRPQICRQRKIAFALQDEVERQLRDLEHKGVIIACEEADWASPIVAVRKSNGDIRVCGDCRQLNANIVDDKFPLPVIEELLAEIGSGNGYFASIDLKAAYHQINLAKECQPLITVVTHIGTFMYTMMSFGLKTAPNAFQRIITRVLKGCDYTLVYLDDILIVGKTS